MYLSLVNCLDIGNVIFFMGTIPQMRSTYINRKSNLKAISMSMLVGYLLACLLFVIGNSYVGAYVGAGLNLIVSIFYIMQIYWKVKWSKW